MCFTEMLPSLEQIILGREEEEIWGKTNKKSTGAAQPAQEFELHVKPDLKIPATWQLGWD